VEKAWQLAGIAPLGPLDHYDFLVTETFQDLLATLSITVADALETFRLSRESGE
jgi:hypothetical protein